jgi:hypothetical protein
MNILELEKLKLKLLNDYKAKNDNRAKEYCFSLDADTAAKLDLQLDLAGISLGDHILMLASKAFDGSVAYYAHKNNLCGCKQDDDSVEDMLKRFLK